MPIFEFYSGIGGMHQSLKLITKFNLHTYKLYPFDVNINANPVYELNFNLRPSNKSLEYFYLDEYESLCKKSDNNYTLWTMSPPCQPFTYQGLQKDLNDERTTSYQHLVKNILAETKCPPHYILLENVKNFEYSNACSILLKVLEKRKYKYIQFLLSPDQIGIPNRRLRYYLLAISSEIKNAKFSENIVNQDEIYTNPPSIFNTQNQLTSGIGDYLGINLETDYINNFQFYLNQHKHINKKLLSDDFTLHHVCNLESTITTCFTKSYGKKLKGSGSILNLKDDDSLNKEKYIQNLRFFSPEELLKIFYFPSHFSFPGHYNPRDKYKLIGNSINIKVVSMLLKYLLT